MCVIVLLPHLFARTLPPCRSAGLARSTLPQRTAGLALRASAPANDGATTVNADELAAVLARFPLAGEGAGAYVRALLKYNELTNVYSQGAYAKLPFHIHDSLTLGAIIARAPGPVVDLGSGSGLPSVCVALSNPGVDVWAVESKSRKTTFLKAVAAELGLTNLHVLTENIVELSRLRVFDAAYVTAKAFKPLGEVVPLAEKAIMGRARILVPISEAQVVELGSQGVLDPASEVERVGEFIYFARTIEASRAIGSRQVVTGLSRGD
jgi:16S rRNA G527 N7-methylase RsmG